MRKPKPPNVDDKIIKLLKEIRDKLDKSPVIPELAAAIRETQRLVRGIDRMVPDNPQQKDT